jgi:hypothetical protein
MPRPQLRTPEGHRESVVLGKNTKISAIAQNQRSGSFVGFPVRHFKRARASRRQGLPHSVDLTHRCVDSKQNGPTFDRVFQFFGPGLRDAGGLQDGGHASRDVTGRLPEAGRERPRGYDRPDPGQHDCDSSQHEAAQLAKSRCSARILDVGSGRRVHLLRQSALFVMTPGHDRNLIALDACGMQGTSRGGSRCCG